MLVQFPNFSTLSPKEQDDYWAKGWFRNSNSLLCLRMVCIEEQLFSLLKIRLPLQDYKMSKSLRKICRQNKKFEVRIAKAKITQDKEKLYQQHLHRFKGHISASLEEFFIDPLDSQFFDTHEVCIYDNEKLIAFSFFDKGEDSIASIIGIFDHTYYKHSLGLYTMLCEVQNAMSEGKKYYYPGYVLHKKSSFDYKLRLGDYEYYTWKKWVSSEKFSKSNLDIYKLNKGVKVAEKALQQGGISYQKKLYPYFSFGYIEQGVYDFAEAPICLVLEQRIDSLLILEYALDKRTYRLARVGMAKEFKAMLDKYTPENDQKSQQESLELEHIIYYQVYLGESKNMEDIIQAIKQHLLPSQSKHQTFS